MGYHQGRLIDQVHLTETGFHLAFAADSVADVDAFHDAACSNGARDNGAPGPRPQYGDSYYAAFVIDPDGHHLEAVNNPHSEDGLPSSGSPYSAQSETDPSC